MPAPVAMAVMAGNEQMADGNLPTTLPLDVMPSQGSDADVAAFEDVCAADTSQIEHQVRRTHHLFPGP